MPSLFKDAMKKILKQINNNLLEKYKGELAPKTRDYISPSMIGHDCSRKIWYSSHEYEGLPFSLEQARLNELKYQAERMVYDAVRNSPFNEVICSCLAEKDALFHKFKKSGLREYSYRVFDQCQYLMGNKDLKELPVFMLNMDTGELWGEVIDFDDFHYQLLKSKAESIMMMKEPPKRINDSPLWFQCKKCQFRKECHR
jgi:hypothetical protein